VAVKTALTDLAACRRITESFYNKKREEFRERQEKIQLRLGTLQSADEEYYLSVSYLLKVANKAPGLFKSSEVQVKRQILKLLLQNCQVDDVSLCVAYRSPFHLFAKATSRTEWLPELDNTKNLQAQGPDRPGPEGGPYTLRRAA
jgi:hypothetical protein